ncbi:hypothetical protein F966_00835 [Acinetobacter higginsii]|uniref:Uncharacterized protein n=1 Tax=Acinetobacter higginsii TaxID=70347 RepID=N8XVI2_9GAMM|nr:hypothetical protein [Acinetobacter higginsii]ENV11050.1 hypothetical protein F966_00835 [Acinetobacter higginsii]
MIKMIKKSDSEITDLYLKIDNWVNEIYGVDEDLRFRDPYGQLCEKLSLINESDVNSLLMNWAVSRVESETNITFLKKVLHVINLLDSCFWEYVRANQLKINNKNIEVIKELLLSAKVSQELSISERYTQNNFFEKIVDLKKRNAWSELYVTTHSASEWFQYFVDRSAVSGFKILLDCSLPEELESVLDGIDISVLWGIFANIDSLVLLNFIDKIESKFIVFTALSSIFPFNGSAPLEEDLLIDDLLVNIFVKAGSDINFISELFDIFNRYPTRYERLQKIIGNTLARLESEDVIVRYYKSLSLYTLRCEDKARVYVKNCLETFEVNCQDKLLINRCWEIAFELWSDWNFDISLNNYLIEIKYSIIDFAIVKYYLSKCNQEQIGDLIEENLNKMMDIGNEWYLGKIYLNTDWNKLKSQMQPLYHAREICLDSTLSPLQDGFKYNFENLSHYVSFRVGN